jgi:hypothetical protein
LIWEPYDYPQNPDGSFTKWTSLNPPYHPDGRPFWIPGSEIDFLTYDQYWLVSEGIEFDPDGPLKTKYFAFLNTETGQPYWDPFNPPEETVNLVDSLVNSVSGDKYWTELSSVEI